MSEPEEHYKVSIGISRSCEINFEAGIERAKEKINQINKGDIDENRAFIEYQLEFCRVGNLLDPDPNNRVYYEGFLLSYAGLE